MNQNYFDDYITRKCRFAGFLLFLSAVLCAVIGCAKTNSPAENPETTATSEVISKKSLSGETTPLVKEKKIGVLLISHGSHSKGWRKMVSSIGDAIQDDLLKKSKIAGIRSAFMEYTEPFIATQLKEFDREGYTDIIVVPLLLTVSSHSFDDIPTICGQKEDYKTTENLRLEGIEIYKPQAKVHIAPLLDYPSVLEKNVVRRAKQMSKDPKNEGIVLVAYGSKPYEEAWVEMIEGVSAKVKKELNVSCMEYAWCGHIVHYKSEPTEKAIRKVLDQKERALVIPILVAVDETFQGRIIGGAVKNVDAKDRIAYRRDAILPDENINRWIVEISRKMAAELTGQTKVASTANVE